jgi:regulator of sirC expression with transglutaminase-like and TPR domain
MGVAEERREAARRALSAAGTAQDGPLDIARLGLSFSTCRRPGADPRPYEGHLKEIAVAASKAVAASGPELEDRRAALAGVMVGEFGYEGDSETYDDLSNADLMEVIDRRKGLPVALGILWIHAARAAGVDIEGINFPGHFLLRISDEIGERQIIDPFHGGVPHSPKELRDLVKVAQGPAAELTAAAYSAVTDRDVLLRLENNIKVRLIRTGDLQEALEIISLMRLLAPQEPGLVYEAGMTNYRLGRPRPAVADLESFLKLSSDQRLRQDVTALLQRLKNELGD